MAEALDAYSHKSVNRVTTDRRISFDQAINIILDDSHECVFSITEGVEQVLLGFYIIRGDNVALIGEIDEDFDRSIDFSRIHVNRLQAAKT